MTLNFPRCTVLPLNSSEDNLVPSVSIGDRSGEGLVKPRCFNWGVEDLYDLGRDGGNRGGGSCEPIAADDILDLLPSDPFGMELSATFTAIAGWIEDLEIGSPSEDRLVAGLNLFWNQAMMFESEAADVGVGGGLDLSSKFGGMVVEEKELGDVSRDGELVSVWDVEEFLSFGDEDPNAVGCRRAEDLAHHAESCSDGGGGATHDALMFALSYLGVRDLLTAERVCRSMRSSVQNDALLWRRIHIDQPLSKRITDDALLQLTRRAQGGLQYLSLVECSLITDDGLKRVLESNPKLTKLSVPGCTRLSIEGLVNNLKAFKSAGIGGIKCLQIGGLYGVTQKHFEELKFLLDADENKQPKAHKQRFYHTGNMSHLCDNECQGIDIEMCPRCQNLRLVYDCPAETCQGEQPTAQQCRGCSFCISRCVQCGRCINDSEYQETFCLDLLCSGCWKQLLQWQEKLEERGAGSKHTILHQEMRYRVCVYHR
ncbi:F-box protein SKIP14-like [Magnolia sinica]|uniref:F-box protein SKIP14-like n=1 Tax=Magnolia sinica TaxID=86752 RepID=UPI00265A2888|nr:F-box protein SKIP14-like [Magnolia sinica]